MFQLPLFPSGAASLSLATAISALSSRPLVFGDRNQIAAHKRLEAAMVLAGEIDGARADSYAEFYPTTSTEAIELLKSMDLEDEAGEFGIMAIEWRRFVLDRAMCGHKYACLPVKTRI